MPRIFLSHSSNDDNEATALRQWLIDQRPELVNEIFLDIAEDTGLAPGQRWKDALRQANQRSEAVICLVSHSLGDFARVQDGISHCRDARKADPGRPARRHRRLRHHRKVAALRSVRSRPEVAITVSGEPVLFNAAALDQLKKAIEGTGIGPENFVWPPRSDPLRAPCRGWEPFEDIDAGVFSGGTRR
jgi:hypothetical protein